MADEICERLIRGEPLTAIIEFDEDGEPRARGEWPCWDTIDNWANPDHPSCVPSFVHRFARARVVGGIVREERNLIEARTVRIGEVVTIEHSEKDGKKIKRVQQDMIERSKLIIETNRQYNARMDPYKWNERMLRPLPTGEADGSDDGTVHIIIEGGLPDEGDEPFIAPETPPA